MRGLSTEPIHPCHLRQINPSGKVPLPSSGKSLAQIRASRPIRGDVRTSRTLRRDAVDADDGERRTPDLRTAKSCGPGAPMLA
jgi:hypothetical protein